MPKVIAQLETYHVNGTVSCELFEIDGLDSDNSDSRLEFVSGPVKEWIDQCVPNNMERSATNNRLQDFVSLDYINHFSTSVARDMLVEQGHNPNKSEPVQILTLIKQSNVGSIRFRNTLFPTKGQFDRMFEISADDLAKVQTLYVKENGKGLLVMTVDGVYKVTKNGKLKPLENGEGDYYHRHRFFHPTPDELAAHYNYVNVHKADSPFVHGAKYQVNEELFYYEDESASFNFNGESVHELLPCNEMLKTRLMVTVSEFNTHNIERA